MGEFAVADAVKNKTHAADRFAFLHRPDDEIGRVLEAMEFSIGLDREAMVVDDKLADLERLANPSFYLAIEIDDRLAAAQRADGQLQHHMLGIEFCEPGEVIVVKGRDVIGILFPGDHVRSSRLNCRYYP